MKLALPVLLAGALLAAPYSATLASAGSKSKPTTYTVDTQASKLEWGAEKVTGKHNGTLMLQGGTVEVTNNLLTGGTFTVDMTSLKELDIEDPGMNAKLTGHLKSDDFFAVEKHPTSTFTITKVEPIKGAEADKPNCTVTGNLTIKGITKPITFPVRFSSAGNQATATGSATVDRTEYDIKIRSAKFFNDLGNRLISDNFTVTFNVVAKKG